PCAAAAGGGPAPLASGGLVAAVAGLGSLATSQQDMQEPRKFCGLNITRSIQDRVFLGLMGLVFMLPTGYVLYHHHSMPWPKDMSIGARLLVIFIDEVVLVVFLLALYSFIWGIAAPRWIE